MRREQMPEPPKSNFREAMLTPRDIFEYIKVFDIKDEDLNDPNATILDLGAGLRQELARQAKELNLQSKIVSLDPKLGLSLEKDLALLAYSQDRKEREDARKNLPPMPIAAISTALPFKEHSFDKIYALYSVPYYLESPQEIKVTLEEMIRTTKDGGTIKAFPLDKNQATITKQILNHLPNLEFNLEEKVKNEDWLLTIKKKKTAE